MLSLFSKTKLLLPVALLLGCVAINATATEFEQELRVVWGGSQARSYVGSITIENGTLQLVRNLSMQENAPGTVVSKSSNTLEINQNFSSFGGCDISIKAAASAQLSFQLNDPATGQAKQYRVNVVDLQQQNWIETLDESDNRIAVERQNYDRLRVDRSSLGNHIFDCDSILTTSVSGYRTGLSEGAYYLVAAWSNGKGQAAKVPIQIDSQGNFGPTRLELRIPSSEGSAKLDLSVERSGLMSALTGSKPLLTRGIELFAFQPDGPRQMISGWSPILAIDTVAAVKPEGLAWLSSYAGVITSRALELPESIPLAGFDVTEQLNRLIPVSKAVSNFGGVRRAGQIGLREVVEAKGIQRCALIGPTSWLALPLTGLQAGKPHRLRIQIPADQPSSLSVSLQDAVETDEQLLEPQSSFELKEDDCGPGRQTIHEMVFWPRSDSITIRLASCSRLRSASIGKILVEQGNLQEVSAPPINHNGRHAAVYIDQPLLVECFGAPREKDPQTQRYYESWKTWQAVADRLVLQMQTAGMDTLVLSAISGSNSLMPLQSLSVQHRLNKATFFTDSRSPDLHDTLELLLKYFDRAGLRLIVEVELSNAAQFPQLTTSVGAQQFVQTDLLAAKRSGTGHTGVPLRLNPLNRSVQEALTAPILEVVRKYKDHPSFAGLSVRVDSQSQFLFAGDRWGYNAELLEQFASENGFKLPKDELQTQQLFSGPSRFRFLSWRAQQLTSNWTKLAYQVHSLAPNCQLSLNVIRLLDLSPDENQFVEPDVVARNPQQQLLSYGVDMQTLSQAKGLTITLGTVRHSKRLLTATDWFRTANAEQALRSFQLTPNTLLVTHQPRSQKLATEYDRQRGPAKETWIYPDAIRYGQHARRLILDQMADSDPNLLGFGGWHPIWLGDPEVLKLMATFKSLPPTPMIKLSGLPAESPLVVRVGTHEKKHYASVTNHSPWEMQVRLTLKKAPHTVAILARPEITTELTGNEILITVPAFDMIGLSSQDESLTHINEVNYELPPESQQNSTRRLEVLDSLLAQAADPGQQQMLFGVGGTFEQWLASNKPKGWTVSALPQTTIEQASEIPHSGSFSIMIENRNPDPSTAWIQSAPIEMPETGRLTVRAWLRTPAASNGSAKVRLGIIGRLNNGERYQRSVLLGGNSKDGLPPLADDWGRRPAELHVTDVPVEELTELQVAIDLIGPGKIWVDDVEVIQSWLHPDERNLLRGQLLVAKQKLAAGNPSAAERLLNSPWSEYLLELNTDKSNRSLPSQQGPLMTPVPESVRGDWNRSKPAFQQLRESMRQRWNR
jgi:hypothetical protein